jgi:uncharacterized protein (TIGR00299 family) protein
LKTAYLDCFSGISGDMFLGALADAGLDFPAWHSEIGKLKLSGFSVSKRKVKRAGIAGTKLTVKVTAPQPHRNLPAIERLIRKSGISPWAKETALKIFIRLAEAEAAAHGASVDEVHFHEVGAVDSVVDIAGSAIALEMMGIEKIFSSPLNLGSGVVKFSHGTFPVPAPATAELIKGIPAYSSGTMAELTTPTGAAIATTLAEGFGPMPVMTAAMTGYGAGGRDIPDTPNMLRVFIGDSGGGYGSDTVDVIETNIDDMDPRICGHVMERLLEAGALDVWLTPIIMKKSRPAYTLSVIADAPKTHALTGIIMSETTTFGIRVMRADRQILSRKFLEVKTRSGTVRVKLGLCGGKVLKAVPEYEDARALAIKTGRPLGDILKEIEKLAGFIDIS